MILSLILLILLLLSLRLSQCKENFLQVECQMKTTLRKANERESHHVRWLY